MRSNRQPRATVSVIGTESLSGESLATASCASKCSLLRPKAAEPILSRGVQRQPGTGIPDMRFINRKLPIADVARALDLQFDGPNKLRCWHPERHKNADRTPSVGIRLSNNTIKCFGCDSKPMGPIDMVLDFHGMNSPADAAQWIAARFDVPSIPAHKRLTEPDRGNRTRVGHERGLELLIRSGLWARLPPAAQAIAPCMLALEERRLPSNEVFNVQISYRGIARVSGIRSHNAIRKALVALNEMGFLDLPNEKTRSRGPERETACYTLTPCSDRLWELAQEVALQTKQEIAAEVELRRRIRSERVHALKRLSGSR